MSSEPPGWLNDADPCPFCGCRLVSWREHKWTFLVCGDCFAQGPFEDGVKSATKAWNSRVAALAALTAESTQ